MMLLALAVLTVPSDPIYQLEAEPGQYATGNVYDSCASGPKPRQDVSELRQCPQRALGRPLITYAVS